jgi:hypothetical protein
VRALLENTGLSVAAVTTILAKIADQSLSVRERLRIAHRELSKAEMKEVDLDPALAFIRRWGWAISDEDAADLTAFAIALNAFMSAGVRIDADNLDAHARAMWEIAELEFAEIPEESQPKAVNDFVLTVVLTEPLLLVLRRLAQREMFRRREARQRPFPLIGGFANSVGFNAQTMRKL